MQSLIFVLPSHIFVSHKVAPLRFGPPFETTAFERSAPVRFALVKFVVLSIFTSSRCG